MTTCNRMAVVVGAIAYIAVSSVAMGSEARNEEGATDGYGLISRKQSASKRVIFQPLAGKFVDGAEVEFFDLSAKVVCKGKISSIYRDEVYATAEDCERFDDLMIGYGVAYNGQSIRMREVYQNGAAYKANIREREWDRYIGVPMDIGEDQFEKMVKNSSLPVLVEFYVNWCPYCNRFVPVLGEVAKDFSGKVRVATIDAEKNTLLRKEYEVKKYPSLFLMKGGKVIDSWTGAYATKEPVISRVNKKLQ